MTTGRQWRKAIVISMLLHGIVLTGVGYIAAKTFVMHEAPEQYLELELAISSDASVAQNVDHVDSGNVATNVGQATAAMSAPSVSAAVVSRETAPSVQASASSMSVLAVENGGDANDTNTLSGEETGVTAAGTVGTGKDTGARGNSGAGKSAKGSGISSPGILSRVDPRYPEQARQAGRQGTVVLKIQILESGRPGHVSVYHSSGSDLLDEAAIDAVRQWRFIPAKDRESGQAIVCYTTMPVVFKLNA